MAFCAAAAIIGWAAATPIVAYVALGTTAVVVLYGLHRILSLADKRPAVAILDGAEFVTYQKLLFAQKGAGALPPAPSESDPTARQISEDSADLDVPDSTSDERGSS